MKLKCKAIRNHLLFWIILIPVLSMAQNDSTRPDSLFNLLEKNDRQPQIYYELFKFYLRSDKEKALQYALDGHQIASNINDSLWMVKTGRAVGWVYINVEFTHLAIDYFENALAISKSNGYRDQTKFLLNSLGVAYANYGDYDQALEYHLESLKIREEENDLKSIAVSYNNIGLVYYRTGDFDKALQYYLQALKMSEEIDLQALKDKNYINKSYVNIGLTYISLHEYKKALEYFNKALNICNENCSDNTVISSNYGIGRALFDEKKYDSAEVHFNISNEVAEKTKSDKYLMLNQRFLAEINLYRGNYQIALVLLNNAQLIADSLDSRVYQKENYRVYAQIYEKLADYKLAYKYQREHQASKDSIYNQEMIKNLANIQLDFQEEKNQRLISIKDSQIRVSKQLNYLLALFVALFSAFLVVLYRSYVQKQRSNQKLAEANSIIEEKNQQLTDLNAVLEDRVKERTQELRESNLALKNTNVELDTFIYRTSHDIRGPLASLLGLSQVAMFDVKDSKSVEYFRKLNITAENLNAILSRLLDIAQVKTTAEFDSIIDFDVLIDEVMDDMGHEEYEDKITFNYTIEKGVVLKTDPYLMKVTLSNLIDNAYKLYDSSDRVNSIIHVEVGAVKDEIEVKVIDNGIGVNGMDASKVFEVFSKTAGRKDTAGLGLYLVKLAVERMQGNVSLGKTPEGYTAFSVKLPMQHQS